MSDKMRVLVVDDEQDIADFVCDVALDMGFDAMAIHNTGQFEQTLATGFQVLVLDLVMPERDGVELLRYMAEQQCNCMIILISGYDTGVLHSAQKLATEHGLNIIGTLSKPFVYEDLETLLDKILSLPEQANFGAAEQYELPDKDEFLEAIEQEQLEVYFQPQVNIKAAVLTGVEALIRWNHPQRGLLMPNIIIPLAEQSGLMEELTALVIEQSFQQLNAWQQCGLKTKVSINIAATSLKELGFPEWLNKKVLQYHLHPEQVALEITESGLMQDLAKSLDVLTRLRLKMIELSIDDFGTGYSSMVQLYRVPFSEMKIDRSFVMHAATDAEALAIVEIIILLGHKLGMTVVSEGIEDQETWNLLAKLGCDTAQGYFIAKPMPAAELLVWKNNYQHPDLK